MLADTGLRPELIRPLMEQRAETMQAFFAEVDSRYGSWDEFVNRALGVTREQVDLLRETYLI